MSKPRKPTRRSTARPVAPEAPAFTPARPRPRADGWTPAKQVRFVEALAESGCVEEACAAVGMSRQSAYALKARPDAQGFRLAWEAAQDFSVRRLSDACFSRALNGEVIPHFYQGEQVGEHRRYDNRLAMFLLRYRDPLRYAATLDQMVYSGHPEQAAIAFARAREACADAARGLADIPHEPAPAAPWSSTILSQASADAVEQALVAGNAPVYGTSERRNRIADLRRERWEAERRAEEARRQASGEPEYDEGDRLRAIFAGNPLPPDRVSTSSTSDTPAEPPSRPPPSGGAAGARTGAASRLVTAL